MLIGQVAILDYLYFLRVNQISAEGAMFDTVVFCLSLLGAFVGYAIVCGSWDAGRSVRSRAIRLVVSVLFTACGFVVASVIGANVWALEVLCGSCSVRVVPMMCPRDRRGFGPIAI